jgi:hypothetical protein
MNADTTSDTDMEGSHCASPWSHGFRELARVAYSLQRATNAVSGSRHQVYVLTAPLTGRGLQHIGTADGRALRYHTTDNSDTLQSYIRNVSDIPLQTTKKRKRRSAPASTIPPHNASYSSEQRFDSPVPEPDSPDLDTLLQAEIAREHASGPPENVMAVERRAPPPRSAIPHTAPEASGSSSAWTPANQPLTDNQGALPNVSKSRDAAPVAAARWAAIKDPRPTTPGSSTMPEYAGQGAAGAALIDTFPKTKQRHIYGVIGGLESGIDHLNAQVVSLKALLGIDVDDSKPR